MKNKCYFKMVLIFALVLVSLVTVTSLLFALPAAPSYAGAYDEPAAGGGGGGGIPPSWNYVGGKVDHLGVFTRDFTVETSDEKCRLMLEEGTKALSRLGNPLASILMVHAKTPPAPPTNANIVGLVYGLRPAGATFDPPITITLDYDENDVPAGVDAANMVLAYWDSTADEWVVLAGSVVDPLTSTISAPVSHFTNFTVISYTSPAAFAASDLTVTPAEVNVGESVAISATVTNTGDLESSYEATLSINGVVVATEEVTLAGKASQEVTFTTAQSVPESYQVTIGELSGIFVVVKPVPTPTPTPTVMPTVTPTITPAPPTTPVPTVTPAPPTTPVPTTTPTVTPTVTPTTTPPSAPVTPLNWWLIGGIIAVVVIVAALVAWLIIVRRSRGN